MRGYIIIPDTITCNACKYCGSRPVIAPAEEGEYVVKCPNDDSHYQTQPGLIDVDDWNLQNSSPPKEEIKHAQTDVMEHFFFLNGTIIELVSAN